jgi:hypothetical protein
MISSITYTRIGSTFDIVPYNPVPAQMFTQYGNDDQEKEKNKTNYRPSWIGETKPSPTTNSEEKVVKEKSNKKPVLTIKITITEED